jgi:GxxExxY protein
LRECLCMIGQQHGLGYIESIYRQMIAIEMSHRGLQIDENVLCPACWENRVLSQHNSDCILVEGKILLCVRSLLDYPSQYEFARLKTYMNSLAVPYGLIANFGKKQLYIYGVNPFTTRI